MTTSIAMTGTVGLAGELAELMIQNETNQEDSERLSRDAARQAFLANSNQQVAELDAAADASKTGAFVGAAFTIAGAGCGIGASINQFDADTAGKGTADNFLFTRNEGLFKASDEGFSGLAKYASQLTGGTAADHHTAEAKRYETLAAQAKWQADDASTSMDKSDKLTDKVMDIVQSLNQDQNSANSAIIGRI